MFDNNQPSPEDAREQPYLTKDEVKVMLTEPRFQQYFEAYQPYSVEAFIDHYASRREMWWQYGKMYVDINEREETQWISAAARHLSIIQQKRLFDAQCLWRAEQVTYPGVELCYDFRVWERDVLNCPFLEPISEEDVDLYAQYLSQPNVDLDGEGWISFEDWQDYDEIKQAYATDNANRNFPEWYDFHNGRTGTGVYLTLPNIRGEKEDAYTELAVAKEREENQPKWDAQDSARDKRPSLQYWQDDKMEFFIRTFDDARTLEFFRAYKHSSRHRDQEEEIRQIVELLLKADEPIPIQGHHDFREALRLAEQQYRCRKIAEHLPLAYEEYWMNHSIGVLHGSGSDRMKQTMQRCREIDRERILEGRRLAGEPEDLDF